MTLRIFLFVVIAVCVWWKTCEGGVKECSYEYIGCYKDKSGSRRAYDMYYATTRGSINWDVPCTDFQTGVEHCCKELAALVPQKHYFGVQYYGECWTYNQSLPTDYDKHGVSQYCTPAECGDRVGADWTNAIYFAYQCGVALPTSRVINGQIVQSHFPFMASLRLGDWHFCGATLIASRWLLTAAHCFKWTSGGGELNPIPNEDAELGSKSLGGGHVFTYDKIILHPDFDVWQNEDLNMYEYDYDVALLRLTEIPDIDGKQIQPVCLDNDDVLSNEEPSNPNWEGMNYTVAGWGSTMIEFDGPVDNLQSVETPQSLSSACPGETNPRKACFKTGPPVSSNPPQGRGTCSGDSGGPFFYKQDGRYVQVAIINTFDTFEDEGLSHCAPPLATHGGMKVGHPEIYAWIMNTMDQYNNA